MSNESGINKTLGRTNKGGFMLFGVRVMEATAAGNSFRKSASMNNLVLVDPPDHEQQHLQESNVAPGYASDDVVHPSARSRERKRGVPWTKEEHRLFLLGLQKLGKGDWRGISRNFVKTRTPTQVASHAQKYFLRRNNSRRRRRSSLFDITTDVVHGAAKLEDQQMNQTTSIEKFPFSGTLKQEQLRVSGESLTENLTIGLNKPIKPITPMPVLPSSKMANLKLNNTYNQGSSPLSLKLSTATTSSSLGDKSPRARHSSAFQALSSGDSIISVA